MHLSWRVCGDQKTTCRNQFPPSTMWIPGTVFRPSDLAASSFTFWAIALASGRLFYYISLAFYNSGSGAGGWGLAVDLDLAGVQCQGSPRALGISREPSLFAYTSCSEHLYHAIKRALARTDMTSLGRWDNRGGDSRLYLCQSSRTWKLGHDATDLCVREKLFEERKWEKRKKSLFVRWAGEENSGRDLF